MNVVAIPLHEERELALTQRLAMPSPVWRVSRLWTRIAFFVLACIATSMLFGLVALMELPKGVVTAVLTVGFAEVVMRRKKFLRTGIEEGFYIAGLCAFIFGLPGEGEPEAILLFVAAFLIAGTRVANGLFIAIAVALVILYSEAKLEETAVAAASAAMLFVVFALMHAQELKRPFLAFACALLTATLLPAAVILWWAEAGMSIVVNIVVLAGAIGIGAVALKRRDRALLIGAIVTFIFGAFQISERFDLAWEWKLLAAGVAALVIGLALNRLLRHRTHGLTSDALEEVEHANILEMAGAAVVTPTQIPDRNDELQTGGGSFGGAGATGDYR